MYWYRPTPKGVTCTADTLGVPTGVELLSDVVFATTMLMSPAQLTVTSGNQPPVTVSAPAGITTFNFTMGLGAQQFSVSRNGQTLFGGTGGLQIVDSCLTYNYNAYVGSFPASGGSNPPPPASSTTLKTVTTTATSSTTKSSQATTSSLSMPTTSSTITTSTTTSTTTIAPPATSSSSSR